MLNQGWKLFLFLTNWRHQETTNMLVIKFASTLQFSTVELKLIIKISREALLVSRHKVKATQTT